MFFVISHHSQHLSKQILWFLLQSDGVAQTRFMAEKHCLEAISQIKKFCPSPEQEALITITHKILNRLK